MKTLLDMNLPPKWVELPANGGINAVHWYKIGAYDASDASIMEYARDNDYVVITCDLDFSTILSVSQDSKPSVVQIRATCFNTEHVLDLLISALKQNMDDLEKGAILSIDLKKSRLRLLPI